MLYFLLCIFILHIMILGKDMVYVTLDGEEI